jgi:hypothetical protein
MEWYASYVAEILRSFRAGAQLQASLHSQASFFLYEDLSEITRTRGN